MAGGNVLSEPGFAPSLNAKFEGTGNDYVRSGPDGKRTRFNTRSVIKTNDEA